MFSESFSVTSILTQSPVFLAVCQAKLKVVNVFKRFQILNYFKTIGLVPYLKAFWVNEYRL